MKKMTTKDFYTYKSVIETANKCNDKDALQQIQLQLVSKYGLDNSDVKALLKLFKFTV